MRVWALVQIKNGIEWGTALARPTQARDPRRSNTADTTEGAQHPRRTRRRPTCHDKRAKSPSPTVNLTDPPLMRCTYHHLSPATYLGPWTGKRTRANSMKPCLGRYQLQHCTNT